MATAPLYKRYGHFFDAEENSSAEERFVKARFEKIAGVPVAIMAEPVKTVAVVEANPMMEHLTGLFQWLVFCIFFNRTAIDTPLGEEEGADPEVARDYQMAVDANAHCKAIEGILNNHKQLLYRVLQRSRFIAKTPLAVFHAEMFKWRELHRIDLRTAPKGAYNVWNNEPFRADVACTFLFVHPLQKDAAAKTHQHPLGISKATPEPFGIYLMREHADLLVMAHTAYFFIGYATAAVYATAPTAEEQEGKSFHDTWLLLTGGNDNPIDTWVHHGSAPFVKAVVHIRDALEATMAWIEPASK